MLMLLVRTYRQTLYIPFAVERGLAEIKRLDIEAQLWDESRRELEEEIGNSNIPGRSDF